jgi:hypothetical protein
MCETLLTLLNEAENECIEVIEISFKGKTKGLYDRDDRSKGYSKYRNGLKGLEKQRSGNWKRTAESG